ncbi:MAG: ATP-binding cassette domain-containing protein, partial [Acidimicrobiales bacterium]|nr:ATP-binding cassette domain-containing protein [Acidimicrobiales bacterium]
MADAPVVRLEGVSKAYPSDGSAAVEVLREVDLELAVGEKASLVGPSGSGKSTLLSLIAGLVRPDTGRVVVQGAALDELGDRDRAQVRAEQVGIALQSDNLIPFLSARENIVQAIRFAGRLNRGDTRRRADALLDRFGIAHRADHRPRHLSGGEAQRVALAVALANEPSVLLADEVV